MNFLKYLEQLDTEQLDKESEDRFLDRKNMLGKMGSFSKKMALAAVPMGAFTALANPAKAQSTNDIVGVLNFALTLEYLENEYYQIGNAQSGLIPSEAQPIYDQIAKHEQQHVAFLENTIDSLGGQKVDRPNFDFTAGGMFDPFNNYDQFLILSQAFEDTGVRAYKGQAPALQGTVALRPALQIHSVEARHAAEVRRLRGLQGWILQDNAVDGVPATQATYAGEDQTTQLGVDIPSITDASVDSITEAWDEFLTMDEVLNIAGLFIVSDSEN